MNGSGILTPRNIDVNLDTVDGDIAFDRGDGDSPADAPAECRRGLQVGMDDVDDISAAIDLPPILESIFQVLAEALPAGDL